MTDISALLRDPPELNADGIALRPLDETRLEDVWRSLHDPETIRMTHTHARFTREAVHAYLAGLRVSEDRADWAILSAGDGAYLGEVVLNELDAANHAMNFRIALSGPHVLGRGHGTTATRCVLDFAFGPLGLHRVSLDVAAYNPRARRVYEKCGFVAEGVLRQAIHWDCRWHDSILMAVLATDPRPSGDRDRR
ncbi:GNAT family N-acetyltransferase [Amycolatopsis antarctica]|uniref:GNAT family N-acetyltransferase n=1 Tax=Amycolatopsis antarctica TaxID=1854586 RepID=A0A263CY40_9PSEU|nr:GNAT family protein [Amycolatopsis antarctica]OZM71063.1 GNAT family N-acetyltransferase [Amycolatopsis antarctica]